MLSSELKLNVSLNFWSFGSEIGVKWPYATLSFKYVLHTTNMLLLSIFGNTPSLAVIMPNIKSYEAFLEFLACDGQTVRRTEEKVVYWVGCPS